MVVYAIFTFTLYFIGKRNTSKHHPLSHTLIMQNRKCIFICVMSVLVIMVLFYMNFGTSDSQQLVHSFRSYQPKIKPVKRYLEHNPIDAFIYSHPIFGKFNTTRPPKKKKVNILVIVSSAPKRNDRRQMIRQTWWQECKKNEKVRILLIILF